MGLFGFSFVKNSEIEKKASELVELKNQLAKNNCEKEKYQKLFYEQVGRFVEATFREPEAVETKKYGTGTILFQIDYSLAHKIPEEIEKELKGMEKTFSQRLFELIREKGLNEVDVYKRADIDRRHFSKIRSDDFYRPEKDTVILLCFSMKLSIEESSDLLNRAGFSFSRSEKRDIIAQYFISHGIWDVDVYRETLDRFGV